MYVTAWHAGGRSFDYRGHSIFYRDNGTGPPLVCIHGFPTSSWDWVDLWPELTARYRVIALDMIGFGFSAKPGDYAYSLKDQADLHEALLDRLGISECHLLTHDYGDSVAQELLARMADGGPRIHIKSLCMLNGGILPGHHHPRLIQTLLQSPMGVIIGRLTSERQFRKSMTSIFGARTPPDQETLEGFWKLILHNGGNRILHRLIRYMRERRENEARWVRVLREPPVPIRLIFGGADPVSGRHMVDAYAGVAPAPDVVLLEAIGHYPQIESPQEVLEAYHAFRSRVDGSP